MALQIYQSMPGDPLCEMKMIAVNRELWPFPGSRPKCETCLKPHVTLYTSCDDLSFAGVDIVGGPFAGSLADLGGGVIGQLGTWDPTAQTWTPDPDAETFIQFVPGGCFISGGVAMYSGFGLNYGSGLGVAAGWAHTSVVPGDITFDIPVVVAPTVVVPCGMLTSLVPTTPFPVGLSLPASVTLQLNWS